ncbi:MAG TPA: DNA polymerase ligase N-terminal domain-containing protein [Micromonosporaceae bacterium]|jgi:DNA ligase D-like protein (predicted 3'-phosphoesterase)|nr:DNA polymerase ligase N-terminal domain-containing protein [Micromonosporaceae bacterium]
MPERKQTPSGRRVAPKRSTANDGKLAEYHRKRDFTKTPEPQGGERRDGEPGFVIQHHLATADHYDFRLEVDGVLKSWAVPRGPSLDPAQKRLAVPTEDHPLDYAWFEGTIGEGEYGGGTVMVWDAGFYRNTTEHDGAALSMADGIGRGHVTFSLAGTKLAGGFALTRTRTEPKEQWILVKMRDANASTTRDPVKSAPKSALSGRTMRQIAHASGD